MSYTTGYLIDTNGLVHADAEWQNAWCGAMSLWLHITRTYLDPKAPPHTEKYLLPSRAFLMDKSVQRELWGLAYDPQHPRHLRIAQMICFDRAVLRRKDFIVTAEALEQTHAEIGPVTTFADQAAWLRKHAHDESVIGACWNVTSVAASHWESRTMPLPPDAEDGAEPDTRPYDINRDTGHLFIEIPPIVA